MFLRNDQGLGDGGGGSVAIAFGRALPAAPVRSFVDTFHDRAIGIDWTPDLGARIGSPEWFRGSATCLALLAAAWFLSPGFNRPILGAAPRALGGAEWDEARAQSIAPIAWGATTGRHMAAGDLVAPLAETPERPIVDLTATLGEGDSLTSVLERAGVANNEAQQSADLVARQIALGDLAPGTRLDLTLGRRASKSVPRPLEKLAFRARFDLNLSIARSGGGLVLTPRPIAIDHTPLRIEGLVGSSLYRSARAAGVPAKVVEAYIKAIATRVSIGGDVNSSDRFDIIVDRARAATGEVQLGQLAFAGLDQGDTKVQLVRWTLDGRDQWFAASGRGETQSQGGGLPVSGHITSSFGRRYHPILHYSRMHEGVDIGAPYGSPIHATADGRVLFAGRKGGYGNFVMLSAGGNLTTGFGHMSRIAVRAGEAVRAGDVIGYIGMTGLTTGPHVHYEVRRGGVPVNPLSVTMASIQQLTGAALRTFKARVASLLSVRPGGTQLASNADAKIANLR
ncbi:M23 family metallopeptidase [Sphingomonas koreensis]|nr:M23 family metallopeptidase [Sphingomonas koreensis]